METVPYRNTKLTVKTIPKGTLLFRLVKNPKDDMRGVLLKDGTRCITPNYNVFFYPNPFVGKLALNVWVKDFNTITTYVLTKDVKVLWLLKPSKYSRVTKNTKRNFIKRCSKVPQGCLPRPYVAYNPCVSDTIIEKYPDVVGMMALAVGDAARVRDAMKNKTVRNKRFYHLADDSAGVHSIPEMILHPLTKRPQKDVVTTESDKLENNYKILKTFKTQDEEKLRNFMDKHAEYNPDTFFYTYKE